MQSAFSDHCQIRDPQQNEICVKYLSAHAPLSKPWVKEETETEIKHYFELKTKQMKIMEGS